MIFDLRFWGLVSYRPPQPVLEDDSDRPLIHSFHELDNPCWLRFEKSLISILSTPNMSPWWFWHRMSESFGAAVVAEGFMASSTCIGIGGLSNWIHI